MHRTLCVPVAIAIAVAGLAPGAGPGSDEPDPASIAAAVEPSIVVVSYTLRYDDGESPRGGGWSYVCPNCGNVHQDNDLGTLVEEERTSDRPGFLVAGRTVVTRDPLIAPRFIESISVRHGDHSVPARLESIATDRMAVTLSLDAPLSGARPLRFDGTAQPAMSVTRQQGNGTWTTTVRPIGKQFARRDGRPPFLPVPEDAILIDAAGRTAGLTFNGEIPVGGWKGDPSTWSWLSPADAATMLDVAEQAASRVLLHATLRFRSPEKTPGDFGFMDDEGEAEQHVTAMALGGSMILVLASLEKSATARLEQIRLALADGSAVDAEFVGSLKEYGALLARAALPDVTGAPADAAELEPLRFALLPSIELYVHGEQEERRAVHNRIESFDFGFRNLVFPSLAGLEENIFLLSREGRVLAFPLSRRRKASEDDTWYDPDFELTPLAHVASLLDDPAPHFDPTNIPLSEDEEHRIAWLGVEIQPLDPELARAMEIADRTNDGESGMLVTFVYEGSPARRGGVEVGDVLLRLHAADLPRPIELAVDEYDMSPFSQMGFPWDRLDEVPEEYYDQIPFPWPTADNFINRKLTELGANSAFALEYLREGEMLQVDMVVEYSPAYYRSAPKEEHEGLGLTVRDMTYEVRRYFQRADDDPGVIVSHLEPGSRASVSGLRPYEIITHVNDAPVPDAATFAAMTEGREELRLSVRRMMRDRIVRVRLDGDEVATEEGADGDG